MTAVLSYLPGVRERAFRLLTEMSSERKPSPVVARENQNQRIIEGGKNF